MDLDMFRGLEFEPQELEDEVLLSEIPLNLLMTSIESQFKEPLQYHKQDYVQSFITKYIVTKDQVDDEDEREELMKLYNQFLLFISKLFKEKLSIGFTELEDSGENDQLELIHYTYRYFITNIKRNFSTFILNYIKEHKKTLAEALPEKKDVTTHSLKNVIEDKDELTIIASLGDCIENILNSDISVEEFLCLSRSDKSDLENDFVDDKYDSYEITGNFVKSYIGLLDEEFRTNIECKVRNKMLNRYRKK